MDDKRKANGRKCLECDRPLVGRQMKNCGQACAQRQYEKRKGITPPQFVEEKLKESSINEKRKLKQIQQNPSSIQFREPIEEIKQLQLQLQYWEDVKRDARKGVYSMATITGGAIGAATQEDKIDKIFGGLIGALVGKVADNWRQRTDLRNAHLAIKNLKIRIKNLEVANELVAKKRFLVRRGDRVKIEAPKASKGIYTADEYKREIIDSLGFKDAYLYLMGDPAKNFYAVLTGSPGQGKSTFSVQFANYYKKNHGRVLLMAAEQRGVNKPLQNLLKSYKADFDIETAPQKYNTEKWIEVSKKYNLVIIDSATNLNLSPEQIEHVRTQAKDTGFLVILQSTKDGNYKGSTEWEHNCDIFMEAKEMKIYQKKSRYTKPAHIHIEM